MNQDLCGHFHSSFLITLFASLIVLLGCSQKPDLSPVKTSASILMNFAVMGEVPYGLTPAKLQSEKSILRQQIADLNNDTSVEFVVHVGDIKKGAPPCTEDVYQFVAKILKTSSKPLIIIPGDNEWNDCENPEEAWEFWITHFINFEENWNHELKVERQDSRLENFAFLRKGTLFIGINLVGGKVHRDEEWQSRIEDNQVWIDEQLRRNADAASSAILFAHANPGRLELAGFKYNRQEFSPLIEFLVWAAKRYVTYFSRIRGSHLQSVDYAGFVKMARNDPDTVTESLKSLFHYLWRPTLDEESEALLLKPILLIHGDGHKWIEDHPFSAAGNRIKRIQVTRGGLEAPLKVEVSNDPLNPFMLIRSK